LNYGGIVADDDDVAQALAAAAVEEARRAGATSLELRHTRRRCPTFQAKEHKVAMHLPLGGTTDAQWTALDRKVRNQVRKSEKGGLTSRDGGPELIDAFYDVFARNMRDLGTPVYARRFFDEVLRAFPGAARIFTVWKDDVPAAASIVIRWRQVMEVPWASSLREFNPLCVNIALYWDMLRHAIEQGCTTFDFGRSTPNEGTYNFKRQWGAEPVPLVWEYWTAPGTAVPDLSPKNARYQAAISLWQRLPVGLTRVIGPPIVRNIP
jgi:FemAB-related protein (PEP-CTERM system-associated)